MYANLAEKVNDFEQEIREESDEVDNEEERIVLYQIWSLIPKIKENWNQLTFDERMSIVGAFTRKVVFSVPSPGWWKMEIEWKIGQQDIMHLRRPTNGTRWTEEEDTILREIYTTTDGGDILRHFQTRTWGAISVHACRDLKLPSRALGKGSSLRLQDYESLSLRDVEYAEANNLDTNDKKPQYQSNSKDEPNRPAINMPWVSSSMSGLLALLLFRDRTSLKLHINRESRYFLAFLRRKNATCGIDSEREGGGRQLQ